MPDAYSRDEELTEPIVDELEEIELNYVDSRLIAERLGMDSNSRKYAKVGRCLSKLAEQDDPPIEKWGTSSSRPKWEVLVD